MSNTKKVANLIYNDTVLTSMPDIDMSSYLPLSGGEVTGGISANGVLSSGTDIYAIKHGLIGKDVDFNIGGDENFAVGHEHKFFGKESFAVHDGNTIGAKGIYWKAIDTENKKIYLTKTLHKTYNSAAGNRTQAPSGMFGTTLIYLSEFPAHNVPYFGKRSDADETDLSVAECFKKETDINLGGNVAGLTLCVRNYTSNYRYQRCFKVVSIEDGCVINYTESEVDNPLSSDQYKVTAFRAPGKTPNASNYIVYFPDKADSVTCNYFVPSTSFGCIALGDGNYVGDYNTFAEGYNNNVRGTYSAAIGTGNNTFGTISYAIGTNNTLSYLGQNAAFGNGLECNNDKEVAIGQYNVSTKSNDASAATSFSIGIGSDVPLSRKNAIEVKKNGDIYFNNTQLSSFYIGNNSLCSLIQNATSGGNAVQSTIVNALQDIGLSANTLSSDIDMGQVLQFMSKLTQLLA